MEVVSEAAAGLDKIPPPAACDADMLQVAATQADPILLDPLDYVRFRGPLLKTFNPGAATASIEEVCALADALIDKVIGEEHTDFIPRHLSFR